MNASPTVVSPIFDYRDYKDYLRDVLAARGRGGRSAFAVELRCQLAYVSQVLNGPAQFSLEQAESLQRTLGHSEEEQEFFLLLVSRARAGTPALEKRFAARLREIQSNRISLDHRLRATRKVSEEQAAIYYSAWYYGAIHMLISIPGFQTRESIVARTALPGTVVGEALEFLCASGLAEAVGGRFRTGQVELHLKNQSHWVNANHANWRARAIQSFDRKSPDDFHYTSAMSMANADVPKIRKIFADAIEQIRAVVRDSPEEDLFCYTVDFFKG